MRETINFFMNIFIVILKIEEKSKTKIANTKISLSKKKLERVS